MERVNILEVLRKAMDLEREGIRFYKRASKQAVDEKTKEAFDRILCDEVNHLEKLELTYDQLSADKGWLVMQDLATEPTLDLDAQEVYDKELSDEAYNEVDAIKLAIKVEKKLLRLYKNALRECKVGQERGYRIFNWLMEFEDVHIQELKKLLEKAEKRTKKKG